MKQCLIKRALSQYSAMVQWLCSAPVSLLLGSTGCTAPVPCLTSSNLPGADPSYPLNETGDGRCLRSCEDVWTVMASCNRANRNFATTLFSRALSTQLKCDFSSKFLQKQTEKEGDSLSAWGITTHTSQVISPPAQTSLLCSAPSWRGPTCGTSVIGRTAACSPSLELKRGYPKAQEEPSLEYPKAYLWVRWKFQSTEI